MPTKEEKHQSSGGGGSSSSNSGGGGNSSSGGTNTNNNNNSSSSNSGTEKHKYCLLCNRNDFTLNTFDPTIEKDLRAIFNTEVITIDVQYLFIKYQTFIMPNEFGSVFDNVCFIFMFENDEPNVK